MDISPTSAEKRKKEKNDAAEIKRLQKERLRRHTTKNHAAEIARLQQERLRRHTAENHAAEIARLQQERLRRRGGSGKGKFSKSKGRTRKGGIKTKGVRPPIPPIDRTGMPHGSLPTPKPKPKQPPTPLPR